MYCEYDNNNTNTNQHSYVQVSILRSSFAQFVCLFGRLLVRYFALFAVPSPLVFAATIGVEPFPLLLLLFSAVAVIILIYDYINCCCTLSFVFMSMLMDVHMYACIRSSDCLAKIKLLPTAGAFGSGWRSDGCWLTWMAVGVCWSVVRIAIVQTRSVFSWLTRTWRLLVVAPARQPASPSAKLVWHLAAFAFSVSQAHKWALLWPLCCVRCYAVLSFAIRFLHICCCCYLLMIFFVFIIVGCFVDDDDTAPHNAHFALKHFFAVLFV